MNLAIAPEYFASQAQASRLVSANNILIDVSAPYRRQTYQNRCRIRTPDGILWLTIPIVRAGRRRSIAACEIDNSSRWGVKHWRSLEFNYRSSPYFEFYEPFIRPLYEQQYEFLGHFTVATTRALIQAFDLEVGVYEGVVTDSSSMEWSRGTPANEAYHDTPYRQTFAGYYPGTSVIDMLFNLGPQSSDRLGLVP